MLKIRIKERPHGLWVFKDTVKRTDKNLEPGSEVLVQYKNRICGTGFANPASAIIIRLYSTRDERFTRQLLTARISDAFRFRRALGFTDSYRVVFGESDYLPGLIIDRYKSCFVLQTLSLGIAQRMPMVVDVLKRLFNPTLIYQKDNSPLRRLEGLKNEERVLWGKVPDELWIKQDGIKFLVDIRNGQKTGYYLDQRINRQQILKLSKDRSVLDLFTYNGSFALYAKKGGAKSVLGIDQSGLGIELAEKNGRANRLKCEFRKGEVFQFLKEHKENYDLIIIDPPSFTRKKADRENGLRGYLKLFMLACEHLNPYGIILLSSCSHYIFLRDLMNVVEQGSIKLRKIFRIFGIGHQAPDHPFLPGMSETEYLRCLFLQSS
ncbi:MAG TPA: class I SAM-dependent rRNA methyltransferase [bacterium (Candidatus Stahlbacteria)]|nr:class I SAM-dependent rRNA methyltransferase [Candidatus Stahlbacteria bacterium]